MNLWYIIGRVVIFLKHTTSASINYQQFYLLPVLSGVPQESILKSVYADLNPGEMLITWPIFSGFPHFKDQQTHDAPDVLLALFLKKLTILRQS